MPLRQRLPGRTAAQVANKCCTMTAFAIKVRAAADGERLGACLEQSPCLAVGVASLHIDLSRR